MEGRESLSEQVIRAVAEAEAVDPLDLNPPLYSAINPDALDALFRETTGEVRFTYHGHTVTIGADRHVTVDS